MAGATSIECVATANAAESGTWGEGMVEIIAGFRDTVMTALLAWGGVSAEIPEEGLRPAPVMAQEQIVPPEPLTVKPPVRTQIR